MFGNVFRHKTVWLSGHTGFKGAWLAQWLLELGARVHGFALAPPTEPALFDQLGLAPRLEHQIADLRDPDVVARSIAATRPDFVFHLAAQPLVRLSYAQPLETYATNVMGTAHVLQALRQINRPCVAIMVTSDKCYENRERAQGYREEDALGGHDPYSSSKAMAELAIASFRRSFFARAPVKIASARAGNVIGGGDWATDRLVPDCVRSLLAGQPIPVRHPEATRPWQHVLDPLSGYLWLAAQLAPLPDNQDRLCSAFNFGPGRDAQCAVLGLVQEVLKHWPGSWEDKREPGAVHEAGWLQLATGKAQECLGWQPVWPFSRAVEQTVNWYRETAANPDPAAVSTRTSAQIAAYTAQARRLDLPWAADS
jgi:CDP-glucose 4,6-dehydratase